MGALKKSVFDMGMSVKRAQVPVLAGIVDNVIFGAVREQTGGRLRWV